MTAPNWSIVTRKIKDLKPHPKNPRRITKDEVAHIKASIEKFGLTDKPIINQDNTLIGGHQRVKVLKTMGWKEVPCMYPDRLLSEEEVEEALIRHNKNSGQWDWDALANNFEGLNLIDWGFSADTLFGDASDEDAPKKAKSDKEDDEEDAGQEKAKKLKECPSCGATF
jgi:hypothetical protein